MSVEAFTWALRVPVGGNQKVVLLGLANHAHPDGSEAYPTLDTLAEYAHCDRSTARRNVRKLVADGWATEDGVGPRGQVKYRLPVGGGKTQPVAPAPARGGDRAPKGVAPMPPEPSIEPTTTVRRAETRAGESLPDDFPPTLREHAAIVHRVLTSVAEQHNARIVNLRAVGLAMLGHPGRRYVEIAHDLASWAQAPPRPIVDVTATYRTFLKREPQRAGVEPLGLAVAASAPPSSQLALVRGGRRDPEAERMARQARRAAIARGEAAPA